MMTTIAIKESSAQATAEMSMGAPAPEFRPATLDANADYEVDVLCQLKANLCQLEDLHGRLKHMMGEISYLLKRG
jgi:hypothetical protein